MLKAFFAASAEPSQESPSQEWVTQEHDSHPVLVISK